MRNDWRIIATYFRLGALSELEYRANFFVQILESGLSLLVALGGLAVVFNHTQTLGGWQPAELAALVGIYLLVGGFIGLVEAIRQVTGTAGGTQVAGARRAMVSGFGMINYDRGLCTGAAILEGAGA